MKLVLMDYVYSIFLSVTKYHYLFQGVKSFVFKARIRSVRNVNERKSLNITGLLTRVLIYLFLNKVHRKAYDMSDIYEPSFHLASPFVLCRQTVCCCC